MKVWLNEKNEFVSLDMEQIKALSEEDKVAYVNAKEQDLKAKFEKFSTENTNLKAEIESLKNSNQEEITELKKSLRELAEKQNQNNNNTKKAMTVLEQLEAQKEAIFNALEKKDKSFTLELKVAQTQTTGYTLANGANAYNPQFDGIYTAPYRPNVILDKVGKGSSSSRTIFWLEETAKEGAFAMIGENELKPLTSETYTEKETSAKKCAGRKLMTEEQIKDLPMLTSIIMNNIKKDHDKNLETNVYSGDGTGDNLKGILEYAQSLVVGAPFALSVVDPNLLDTVICANNQIEVASEGAYMADVIVLNPSDYNFFKTLKDNTGNYIYPTLATGNTLDGLTVGTSTMIAQGNALVMDSSKANLFNYVPFSLRFGYSTGDFENNRITVIGESRNQFYIADEDQKAFVYYNIATTISAITKP